MKCHITITKNYHPKVELVFFKNISLSNWRIPKFILRIKLKENINWHSIIGFDFFKYTLDQQQIGLIENVA